MCVYEVSIQLLFHILYILIMTFSNLILCIILIFSFSTLFTQPVRRRVSMAGEMVAVRTVNKIDEQSSSKSNNSSYRGGDGSSANDDDVMQSYYR